MLGLQCMNVNSIKEGSVPEKTGETTPTVRTVVELIHSVHNVICRTAH